MAGPDNTEVANDNFRIIILHTTRKLFVHRGHSERDDDTRVHQVKFSVATLSTLGVVVKKGARTPVDVSRGRRFAFRTEKKERNGEKRREGEKEGKKGDSRLSLS